MSSVTETIYTISTNFQWDFDDAVYERTEVSFENPDHVAIVFHNFRTRYGLAIGDPQCDALNARLQTFPVISVPTITIATDFGGANASGASYRKLLQRIRAPESWPASATTFLKRIRRDLRKP